MNAKGFSNLQLIYDIDNMLNISAFKKLLLLFLCSVSYGFCPSFSSVRYAICSNDTFVQRSFGKKFFSDVIFNERREGWNTFF